MNKDWSNSMTIKPLSLAILTSMLSMSGVTNAETVNLRIIETTDIHANVLAYDYYKDKESKKIGLSRAATLIKKARAEVINSVLVDNGDLIQGSPMGDYMASKGIVANEVHPVFKAMNQLGYDVGNLGNHEFNYGLEFLAESINDANFPYINANIYNKKTGKNYFTPYIIKSYSFKDSDGFPRTIQVGYIGFAPPQILTWDKKNLEGIVIAKDIKETAKKFIPIMKAEGADVIVAIPHSGLSKDPYKKGAENSVIYLADVDDIDAIAFGHSHAVMPGRWGSHIGVLDLVLNFNKSEGKWNVINSKAETRAIYDRKAKASLANVDEDIAEALETDHIATREFVNQPIGKATDVMYSYLALIQDDPTIQIVNDAQKAYVEQFIQGDPDLDGIPVLSAAAPFKAGGRKNDPSGYTEVESGQLTFRNAADLYLYPNTLVALKVTGKEVKEWLECSAGQFNQIDISSNTPQFLINWADFRTYNFDVIDGVNYQVDVTQPAKYDGSCHVIHPNAQRIMNLTYQGKSVDMQQNFIIASNNYRAYGAKFSGTGSDFIAFDAPDENRSILATYITEMSKEKGAVTPSADNNWTFAPIIGAKKLDIRFETSPTEKAAQFIKEKGQYPMQKIDIDEVGFAVYQIDLQK